MSMLNGCREPYGSPGPWHKGRASFLREEILVETLELQYAAGPHGHTMLDHKFGQTPPVDEDHALGNGDTNSMAWDEKVDVVTNTPFDAPRPTRLPVKAWTSGRPTELLEAYLLA
jgi:hypothetical protein